MVPHAEQISARVDTCTWALREPLVFRYLPVVTWIWLRGLWFTMGALRSFPDFSSPAGKHLPILTAPWHRVLALGEGSVFSR